MLLDDVICGREEGLMSVVTRVDGEERGWGALDEPFTVSSR